MSKREKLVKIFVGIILVLAFTLGNAYVMFSSYGGGSYSPLPSVLEDFQNPDRAGVLVWGFIYFEANETSVENIRVRLFATDELFEEILYTDWEGRFNSEEVYDTGQIVKIEVSDKVYLRTISYFEEDSVSFGILFI